jgi:Ca2+-binding EF-hand superfamily protein
MYQKDDSGTGVLPLHLFVNILQMYVQGQNMAPSQQSLYQDIAAIFDGGHPNTVGYNKFIEHLNEQNNKLTVLETFYLSVKESMMFKASNDLYSIFQPFDSVGRKEFSVDEIKQVLVSRGLGQGKTDAEVFISEYDTQQRKIADFAEIAVDY